MHNLPKNIHFVGAGGAGMSGLALILLGMGHHVSGTDLKESTSLDRLRDLGANIAVGHAAERVGDAELVVISSAIPPANPEVMEARERAIPVIKRGEMLAYLMMRKRGIAVAGSHGKTTTTSMMALVLEKNGLDPTIVVGGEVSDIGGNAKLGSGEFLVAEADESDGSFLWLQPEIAIVTNIENDHLDYYGSKENIEKAFEKFIHGVPKHGVTVLYHNDNSLKKIIPAIKGHYVTYAPTNPSANYYMENLVFNSGFSEGDVYYQGKKLGPLRLGVPGEHNLANALGVIAAGRSLGLDFHGMARSLKCFKGVGRRFQTLLHENGIWVVDDYAHHPTEVRATLRAARQTNEGRVICVFQPHRYSRTRLLCDEFGSAFGDADLARLISDAIAENDGPDVVYIKELDNISGYLADIVSAGDLVITMGAGDIYNAGLDFVKKLKENTNV